MKHNLLPNYKRNGEHLLEITTVSSVTLNKNKVQL